MSNQNFVLTYIQACTGGKLGFSECGPIWQLGIIAVILTSLIAVLIAFRIRARARSVPGAKASD